MFHKVKGRVKPLSWKALKKAIKDRNGSEVVEMVYSTFFLLCILLAALLILTYAIQVNQVSYAAKRLTRWVEVRGYYNQTELQTSLGEFLPNRDELGARVNVSANFLNTGGAIQLREPFTLTVRANYKITILNAGDGNPIQVTLPIKVVVKGQSEIYWKT